MYGRKQLLAAVHQELPIDKGRIHNEYSGESVTKQGFRNLKPSPGPACFWVLPQKSAVIYYALCRELPLSDTYEGTAFRRKSKS